jgi:disulfide bond formation protein DsbB
MNKSQILSVVFILALLMMLGSLYIENLGDPLTNIIHGVLFPIGTWFPPCTLCWYERITMYPMVLLLLTHILWKAKDVEKYILPLAAVGFLFCCYHSALQRWWIPAPDICTTNAPCDFPVINYFGWITLPFLGVITNAIILVLLWSHLKK